MCEELLYGKTRQYWRDYIKARIIINETTGCWEWDGFRDKSGYSAVTTPERRVRTHRLSFEAFTGQRLGKLLGCHRCDNPPCCNPDHIFAGTPKDNTQDMMAKGRANPPRGSRNRLAKLSEDQIAFIASLLPHMYVVDIAKMFGVTDAAINRVAKGRGWTHVGVEMPAVERKTGVRGSRHGMAKLTEEDIGQIRELAVTTTNAEIAERFGIERHHVAAIVNGRSWRSVVENAPVLVDRRHALRRKGEKHGRSKLTEADIPVIRELGTRLTAKQISKLYGVTDTAIYYIVKRKNWAHVP